MNINQINSLADFIKTCKFCEHFERTRVVLTSTLKRTPCCFSSHARCHLVFVSHTRNVCAYKRQCRCIYLRFAMDFPWLEMNLGSENSVLSLSRGSNIHWLERKCPAGRHYVRVNIELLGQSQFNSFYITEFTERGKHYLLKTTALRL